MTQHVALVHYTIQRIAFATCLTFETLFLELLQPFSDHNYHLVIEKDGIDVSCIIVLYSSNA